MSGRKLRRVKEKRGALGRTDKTIIKLTIIKGKIEERRAKERR